MTLRVEEIGDDVLLVRAARFTIAEAIHDDGAHANVIFTTLTGNWNAPDAGDDVPLADVRIMFHLDAADDFVDAFRRVVVDAEARRAEGDPPDPAEPGKPGLLEAWMEGARTSIEANIDVDDVVGRAAYDMHLDRLAEAMDVTLDRATLRTMAFTLAATQALLIGTTNVNPDDPAFPKHVVDATGRTIDVVLRRLDAVDR